MQSNPELYNYDFTLSRIDTFAEITLLSYDFVPPSP